MKKLIGILSVLFVFVMTSFSQNMINNTEFNLIVDGVPSNDFVVTYNPVDHYNLMGEGVLVINFDNPMWNIDFQSDDVIDIIRRYEYYTEPNLQIGIYMMKITYHVMYPGTVNINAISLDKDNYLITKFNAQDTLNSWNDGMKTGYYMGVEDGINSINVDSIFMAGVNSVETVDTNTIFTMGVQSVNTTCYYDSGYVAGVKSVICEFVEEDTLISWGNGYKIGYKDATEKYYEMGFINGVNSVVCEWTEQDTVIAYWNGYSAVDTMYHINKGATSVINTITKSSTTGTEPQFVDIGLSVYPNPVNQGEFINVDCYDFDHVDVYNMNGQKLNTFNYTYIPTSELERGFYVFHVWDMNGNLNSTKVIVQ